MVFPILILNETRQTMDLFAFHVNVVCCRSIESRKSLHTCNSIKTDRKTIKKKTKRKKRKNFSNEIIRARLRPDIFAVLVFDVRKMISLCLWCCCCVHALYLRTAKAWCPTLRFNKLDADDDIWCRWLFYVQTVRYWCDASAAVAALVHDLADSLVAFAKSIRYNNRHTCVVYLCIHEPRSRSTKREKKKKLTPNNAENTLLAYGTTRVRIHFSL